MKYLLIFDDGYYEGSGTNIIELSSESLFDAEKESIKYLESINAFYQNSNTGDAIIYEISNQISIGIVEKRNTVKQEIVAKKARKKERRKRTLEI